MTTRARMALLAAAIVVAIVAFIAFKPADKKNTSTGVPVVVVKGAKPVGGVKTITFNKGDQAKFTIKSDVSDEIHVHGYDFKKDVKAGGQVTFSFPAKIDGEFVVELESRGEQIANLVVNP